MANPLIDITRRRPECTGSASTTPACAMREAVSAELRLVQHQFLHSVISDLSDVQLVQRTAVDLVHGAEFFG